MWKSLDAMQSIQLSDKIWYVTPVHWHQEKLYQVMKADLHYFIIKPVSPPTSVRAIANQVIKYFDIGYNIQVEVRKE